MARATAPHPPNPPKPLAEQPGNPANKLGAWCRSSPGGGTHFQNPNFEISSILALLACLRRFGTLKKKAIPKKSAIYPDFWSMYCPFLGMYPPYLGRHLSWSWAVRPPPPSQDLLSRDPPHGVALSMSQCPNVLKSCSEGHPARTTTSLCLLPVSIAGLLQVTDSYQLGDPVY